MGLALLAPITLAVIVQGSMTFVAAQQTRSVTLHGRVVRRPFGEPVAKLK